MRYKKEKYRFDNTNYNNLDMVLDIYKFQHIKNKIIMKHLIPDNYIIFDIINKMILVF